MINTNSRVLKSQHTVNNLMTFGTNTVSGASKKAGGFAPDVEATRKRLAEQAAAREEAELARLEAAAAAAERKALGLSAAPTPGGAAAPGSARQAAIAKATIGGGVEQYATDRGARAKPECLYCFGQ